MILAQLEPLIAQRNSSKIQAVQMRRGMVLQEAGAAVQWVWFPEDALICIASETMNGESVSGSMMGCNGAYGAFEACGSRVSFTRAFVQIAGSGYRIRADHYRELFEHSAALRTAIHKHIDPLAYRRLVDWGSLFCSVRGVKPCGKPILSPPRARRRSRCKRQPVAYNGPRSVVAKKAELRQRPARDRSPEEEERLNAFFA